MKKWREWVFVGFLVALALAGGWLKESRVDNLAAANVEANRG